MQLKQRLSECSQAPQNQKDKQLKSSGSKSFKSSCSQLSKSSDDSLKMPLSQIKSILEKNCCSAMSALLIFLYQCSTTQIPETEIKFEVTELLRILDELNHGDEIDSKALTLYGVTYYRTPLTIRPKINTIIQKQRIYRENLKMMICKKKREMIIDKISSLMYRIVYGTNKQAYIQTILKLEDSQQLILGYLIEKENKERRISNNSMKKSFSSKDGIDEAKSQGWDQSEVSFKENPVCNKNINQVSSYQVQEKLARQLSKGSFFSQDLSCFSKSLTTPNSDDNLPSFKVLSSITKCPSKLSLNQQKNQKASSVEDRHQWLKLVTGRRQCDCKAKGRENEKSQFLTQLINRNLNLSQQNESLRQELEARTKQQSSMQNSLIQQQKLIKKYEKEIKGLNEKISVFVTKIEQMESEYVNNQSKREKIYEKKIQDLQHHIKQQYKQFLQFNQNLHQNYGSKIKQLQYKLERKVSSNRQLNSKIQQLEEELQVQKSKNIASSEQIKSLHEKLAKLKQEINELHIVKDTLCTEIDVRNSRLEDLKTLLFCQAHNINKSIKSKSVYPNKLNVQDQSGDFADITFEKENQFVDSWGSNWNEWKKSGSGSLFQKSPKFNSKSSDSGSSWLHQTMRMERFQSKDASEKEGQNSLYSYISYLKHKIQLLSKQNQKYIQELKKTRDIKYENAKLMRSLFEHETYRGQQNQIVLSCLYQLNEIVFHSRMANNLAMEASFTNDKFNERLDLIRRQRIEQKGVVQSKKEGKMLKFGNLPQIDMCMHDEISEDSQVQMANKQNIKESSNNLFEEILKTVNNMKGVQ